ncbi:hypothetical protein O6P43_021607 [Quillaja saponaria]|uniref:Secreted protein n=1 Tax=Quillaja saponaria TaxID=32244 RepID=A0AAD7LCM3_QUISA|nr:hypothetical protein O6P43_021607 [Quillaja saponaria]
MGTLMGGSTKTWNWIKIFLLLCLDLALKDGLHKWLTGRLRFLMLKKLHLISRFLAGRSFWDKSENLLVCMYMRTKFLIKCVSGPPSRERLTCNATQIVSWKES